MVQADRRGRRRDHRHRRASRAFIPLVTHGGPRPRARTSMPTGFSASTTRRTCWRPTSRRARPTGLNHPISWRRRRSLTTSGTTPPRPTTARPGGCISTVGSRRAERRGSLTPRSDSTQHAGSASCCNSSGAPANTARFQGVLDEVRVWTGARTVAGQIRAATSIPPASSTGLVARWGMGEARAPRSTTRSRPTPTARSRGTGASWPAGRAVRGPDRQRRPGPHVTLPASGAARRHSRSTTACRRLTTPWSQVSGPTRP